MRIKETVIDFLNCGALPTTANGGRFSASITGAAPPTAQFANGSGLSMGALELALTAANQAQVACAFQSDVLGIPIDALLQVDFLARMPVVPSASGVVATFGLASARNDDPDAIAHSMFFQMNGSAVINAQCDDNVTDIANVSSGVSIGSTWKRFSIQLNSADPGLTGKGDVKFLFDGADGLQTEIKRSTGAPFSMAGSTSPLQLFAQVNKGGGTGVATLQLGEIRIRTREAW